MPEQEINPYENIELMSNVVDDWVKEIERNRNYRLSPEKMQEFISIVKINQNIHKAMISDMKSKDGLIRGYAQMLKM
jgi:hypothetical protein